jgi:hypothetical protein
MKKVLYLIDDFRYIEAECYQHQLFSKIKNHVDVIELQKFFSLKKDDIFQYDYIISVLKLKTLSKHVKSISEIAGSKFPFVIYDQDPWEAYKLNGMYTGTYDKISDCLNVRFFALTTKWWVDYVKKQGHNAKFVSMWMLPEYCKIAKNFDDREIELGFIGTIHPHRKAFFESNKHLNIHFLNEKRQYDIFLNMLTNIKIHIHSENNEFKLADGTVTNIGKGLWSKDVEAASQGCYSIRNHDEGFEDFSCIPTIKTFKTLDDLQHVINDIRNTSSEARQETITKAIDIIRSQDRWQETANILLCRQD